MEERLGQPERAQRVADVWHGIDAGVCGGVEFRQTGGGPALREFEP